MGVIAENAIDPTGSASDRGRFVLFNIELSDKCRFATTAACSDQCVLSMRKLPEGMVLSPDLVVQAAREVIHNGHACRHFALAGREPFEEQALMRAIVEEFSSMSLERRPLYMGAISSASNLIRKSTWLRDTPLSWLIVSVDDPKSSLLRARDSGKQALTAGLFARDSGFVKKLGVNTIYIPGNDESLFRIAAEVVTAGIDQLYIASKLEVRDGVISSVATPDQLLIIANKLADRAPTSTRIFVDIGFQRLLEFCSRDYIHSAAQRRQWRIDVTISSNVHLVAIPDWVAFARLRWDGGIVDYFERYARSLPAQSTRYGAYSPGRLEHVIQELSAQSRFDYHLAFKRAGVA